MTSKQIKAIGLVRAAIGRGATGKDYAGNPTLHTGANTRTLANLQRLGILKVEHIYLRGVITADAKLADEKLNGK